MNIDDIKPILHIIEHTEKLVANQGYTYNEAGLTYNSDVYYGGLYGNEGEHPKIEVDDYKPL